MIRVCFSGVDGSGKTTQIEMLKKQLEKHGVSYKYIHLFSGSNSVASKLHDKPGVSELIRRIRRLKNGLLATAIKVSFRVINVLIDSWLTTWVNKSKKVDVIVYDRYFYDVLAIIAHDFPRLEWVRRLVMFLPKPEVAIILTTKPETVVNRKNEHNLKNATLYIDIYKEMAQRLGVNLIDAEVGVDDTHQEIMKRIEPLLP